MSAATNTIQSKFSYLGEMWWRLSGLIWHDILNHYTPQELYALNDSMTPDVIALMLQYAKTRRWTWNVDVNSAQTKAQADNRTMQLRQAGLLDDETASDALGIDYQQVQQRRRSAMVAGTAPLSNAPQQTSDGGAPDGETSGSVPESGPAVAA